MHAAELAASSPAAQVDPDVLYVNADPIFTSAVTADGKADRRRLAGTFAPYGSNPE